MLSSKFFMLILFLKLASGVEEAKNSCDKCYCGNWNELNVEKKIICPDYYDPLVEISYKPPEKLRIQCYNNLTNIDELEFNFGEVSYVEIEDCLLKNRLSIFEKWNLTNVKNLMMKRTYYVNSNNVLRKDLFEKTKKETFENIYIHSCEYEAIEEDVFDGFINLITIKIEFNFLREVLNIFKYSPKIEKVSFQSNQIDSIPNGINAPNLITLHLNNNKLKNLSENFFLNSPNISLLELSANPIGYLPDNLLFNLKNLKRISIGFEGDDIKLNNLFQENQKLLTVKFRGGNITLSSNLFKNLNNLESLFIYNSKLKELPKDLFKNTTNINSITIREAGLTTLPNGIFSDLNRLKSLDLSSNKLTEWKYEYYARKLPKLETLNLDNNELKIIGQSSFMNLPELQTLQMNSNKITSLLREAFDINNKLVKLELNNNNLSEDEDSFNYLRSMETLKINNNSFSEFPDVNSHVQLKMMEMKYNKLRRFDLLSILALRKVDLTGNLINRLDNFIIFNMSTLNYPRSYERELVLNKNPIWCDCSVYSLIQWINNDNPKFNMIIDDLKCSYPQRLSSRFVKDITIHDLNCNLRSKTTPQYSNRYDCPENCTCLLYPSNSTFNIDCSNLGLESQPNLGLLTNKNIEGVNYTNFSVDLSRNKIRTFDENEDYVNVTRLDLSRNNLTIISWIPNDLKVLNLESNKLENFDDDVLFQLKNILSLKSLNLNENPWNCDCSLNNLTLATRTSFQNILKNPENILCSDGRLLIQLTESELCPQIDVFTIILISIAAFFVITTTILTILYFKHETTIKIWLYSNNILLKYVSEQDADKQKKYDAFVSYSHKDESFILEHLIPELEGGPQPYKLCYHERDWEVGEFINRQIIDSVANSRRTIIVLSKNFLESSWAAVEFRTAHTQAMNEKLNRLIVILYDDVTPDDVKDEELKTYLKTTTYIKWGDPWFWKKLKYAMPHCTPPSKKRKEQDDKMKQKVENVMIAIDDKLDLTNGGTTPNTQTPPALSVDPLLLKINPLQFKSDKVEKNQVLSTHIC
nr:protein toll-like [Onthophagus taurus]